MAELRRKDKKMVWCIVYRDCNEWYEKSESLIGVFDDYDKAYEFAKGVVSREYNKVLKETYRKKKHELVMEGDLDFCAKNHDEDPIYGSCELIARELNSDYSVNCSYCGTLNEFDECCEAYKEENNLNDKGFEKAKESDDFHDFYVNSSMEDYEKFMKDLNMSKYALMPCVVMGSIQPFEGNKYDTFPTYCDTLVEAVNHCVEDCESIIITQSGGNLYVSGIVEGTDNREFVICLLNDEGLEANDMNMLIDSGEEDADGYADLSLCRYHKPMEEQICKK